VVAHPGLRVGQVDGGAGGAQADQADARRDQVRLGPPGEVGPAAAPGRDRAGGVDRADGHHVAVEAGGVDPAALVAAGGDHGDAIGPEPLDRLGEGCSGRVVGRGAERDVEDAQVEAVAGGVGELHGRQDLAEGGGAVGPGDLEVDQVHAGGDPGRPAALAAPGDQPGHEGAVAVGVGEVPLAGESALATTRPARSPLAAMPVSSTPTPTPRPAGTARELPASWYEALGGGR
jgi:hypothetical protein